ncbi:hypothetical protein Tco_0833262 [Tanacetum coccineum]
MARCSNWSTIIQKFSSKLALWKARLLSVGGRPSLMKSVLRHLPIYYMSIYLMPISIQKKLESMRNNFFLDRNYSIANRVHLQDLSSVFRRQPRGGVEMAQLSELQSKIGNVVLSDQGDTWHWALDSLGYSVALARSLINSETLDTALNATQSACNIPIKFNIFIWRLMLNKLPSMINLDKKCIDVGSTFCPIC